MKSIAFFIMQKINIYSFLLSFCFAKWYDNSIGKSETGATIVGEPLAAPDTYSKGGYTMQELQTIIDNARKIVFFGGAGVSTESNIPDFRSVDGLYNQTYDYPPETILSHGFFQTHPEEFFNFHRDKMIALWAKPNKAHIKLAEMEKKGKLIGVITQNIDGLHQAAGSVNVMELHGSVHRNFCTSCGKMYDAAYIKNSTGIPRCEKCGGMIKPDVVLYDESLNTDTLDRAVDAIAEADTMIVAGTSLTVYPAAGLLRYFRGSNLVLINRDETPYDNYATLVIHEKVGEVLDKIKL